MLDWIESNKNLAGSVGAKLAWNLAGLFQVFEKPKVLFGFLLEAIAYNRIKD